MYNNNILEIIEGITRKYEEINGKICHLASDPIKMTSRPETSK
jgi:hypothetical protein